MEVRKCMLIYVKLQDFTAQFKVRVNQNFV